MRVVRALLVASPLLLLAVAPLFPSTASAKSVRGPSGRVVPPGQAKKETPPPNPAILCNAQKASVLEQENRLNDYKSEAAGIEAELAALDRQVDELKKRRDWLKTWSARVSKSVEDRRNQWETECKASSTCDEYEKLTDKLTDRQKPLEGYLDRVRDDINDSRKILDELRVRIEPLRKEYEEKKCSDLVPGETSQATIDRCSDIFSEWNRLQADLNRQNSRVPDLRRRYQETNEQLTGLSQQASEYEAYLAQNCQKSERLVRVRGFSKVRDRAKVLNDDLEKLVTDVTTLRSIKITIK